MWIAGLGDEGGSGPWLAAAMKEFGQPNKEEIAKFEQFIDGVLWGDLQYSEGPRQVRCEEEPVLLLPRRSPTLIMTLRSTGPRGPAGTRLRPNRSGAVTTIPMSSRLTGRCTVSPATSQSGHEPSLGLVPGSGL